MTSEEFHALLDEYEWESEVDRRDSPLTLARLAELERQKGVRFPAFYKEFLSMYGAGDFGSITVLSPDHKANSRYGKQRRSWRIASLILWESLIETRTTSVFSSNRAFAQTTFWMCDHEFGYEVGETDYTDFFDFLAKVGLGIWDD